MINEVKYNHEINDNYYEWVEIYNPTNKSIKKEAESLSSDVDYKNTIYIVIIFTLKFALIASDWSKRQWT